MLTPLLLALLATEAVAVLGLLALVLPTRPLAPQADAYYAAFLTGDEAASPVIASLRWAGAALVAALLLPLLRHAVDVRQADKRPPVAPAAAPDRAERERFDLHVRTQHLLLFSSIGVLALSGLPQAFPEVPGSGALLTLFGGPAAARTAHRAAAAVLDFAVLYHLGYLALGAVRTRRPPVALLPSLRHRRPRSAPPADGFTAQQKLDYWVAALCAPTMTLTGLALVHADLAQAWLPPEAVGVAVALHRSVAVLFVAYVAVVHFYHVHWSPAVFPFSPAMFTGYRERRPAAEAAAPAGSRPIERAAGAGRR